MTQVDHRTAKHLISDQGEVVIDEVRKHWAALVVPVLELIGGIIILFLSLAVPAIWMVPAILGLLVILHATWHILDRRRDRFVITNMRVFRIHGILSEQVATMPLARILDISVYKPFIGRVLGYGHFVFESAAQAQGLREIRYVGKPDQRGLTIQRVIQRAGLRGYADRWNESTGVVPGSGHGTPPSAPPPPAAQEPSEWANTVELPVYDPDKTDTDPIELPPEDM